MMRRRGRSPTERPEATNSVLVDDSASDDGDQTNSIMMMDTDDQEELIRSIAEDAQKQSQRFQTAFSFVGGFAMVVSLFVYPFLCHEECSQRLFSCWAHAVVSSGTHGLSIKLSRSKNRYPSKIHDDEEDDANRGRSDENFLTLSFVKSAHFAMLVVLHILPLLMWVMGIFNQDVEHFHLGLVLGNAVTLWGSFLLVWDAQSTQQALNDLNGVKYEHKTL